MGKGSKGALDDIVFEAEKNLTSKKDKKQGSEELKYKRSYMLKESTITKLKELALYQYPVGYHLEDIVDEAICFFYDNKNHEGE